MISKNVVTYLFASLEYLSEKTMLQMFVVTVTAIGAEAWHLHTVRQF